MRMAAEFSPQEAVETRGPHTGLASLDSEPGPGHQFSVTVRVHLSAHSPASPHPLSFMVADFQGPRELNENHDHTVWKSATEGSSIPSGEEHIHVPPSPNPNKSKSSKKSKVIETAPDLLSELANHLNEPAPFTDRKLSLKERV